MDGKFHKPSRDVPPTPQPWDTLNNYLTINVSDGFYDSPFLQAN